MQVTNPGDIAASYLDLADGIRRVGEPLFVEMAVGTMSIPSTPNNATANSTSGANTGEGGLTVSLSSGSVGATSVISPDSSLVSGFGNLAWPCAIEYADATHDFNVVTGDNGSSTITLRYPLRKDATGAKLSPKYDAAQGQHLTKRATRAWAEYVYAQREVDCVGTAFLDGTWYEQPPKYQALYVPNAALAAYGAITSATVLSTLINETSGLTAYDVDFYLVRPLSDAAGIRVGLHLVGQGTQAVVNVLGQTGVFEAFVGEEKATSGANGVTATLYGVVNGVESVLSSQAVVRDCVRVMTPFSGFDSLRFEVKASVDGTRYVRCTETRVWITNAKNKRLIDKNGRIMTMMDSWGAYYAGEFARWLQVCMRRDGGVGTVTNGSTSGTTSKYGLDWFDTRMATGKYTQVYIHFYTNDSNSVLNQSLVYNFADPKGVVRDYRISSVDQWRAFMMTMASKAIAAGAQPIFTRPGGTASPAQTLYQQQWGRLMTPGMPAGQQRRALPDELTDAAAAINKFGKVRGARALVGDSVFYATGGAPTDAWVDALGTRIGRLEGLTLDFRASLKGTFTIGADTAAGAPASGNVANDGLSDYVAITSYGTTTGITAANSIVNGKQKTAITYAAGFGSGGMRQRYQYPAVAGHVYLVIMKLTGSTPNMDVQRIYDNAAGGNLVTPAAPTDASGNSLSYVLITQANSTTPRNIYINLANPTSAQTVETVTEAVYIVDLTEFDANNGTSFASMTAAQSYAIIYPALSRIPPTSLRLTDAGATPTVRSVKVVDGAITVT